MKRGGTEDAEKKRNSEEKKSQSEKIFVAPGGAEECKKIMTSGNKVKRDEKESGVARKMREKKNY